MAIVLIHDLTSIMSDKEIDRKPVLAEAMPMLAKAKEEKQQIIPMSEKSIESNITGLDTPTLATLTSTPLEEMESNSSNLIRTNSDQHSQLTFRDEGRTENVKSMPDYYFNPFLAGMTMWQAWLDLYNEFAAIGTRLSLNWFEFLWKILPTTVETDNLNNKLETNQEVSS
jgi:hypothetical protein